MKESDYGYERTSFERSWIKEKVKELEGNFTLSLWFNDSRSRNLIIFASSSVSFLFSIHALVLCQYDTNAPQTKRTRGKILEILIKKLTRQNNSIFCQPLKGTIHDYTERKTSSSHFCSHLKHFLPCSESVRFLPSSCGNVKVGAKIRLEQLHRRHNRMIHLHLSRVVKTRSKQ